MIKLIVAHDSKNVIGYKNTIPWQNKEDLNLFKNITKNNTVVMGRKTWESLPFKPLKNRVNIIVTSQPLAVDEENVAFVKSIYEAIAHHKVRNDIYIIGGASIYEQALQMDIVDEALVSLIPGEHEGDTFFPVLDVRNTWIKYHVRKYETFDHITYVKDRGQFYAAY
jgi:dihydrofolate reductase